MTPTVTGVFPTPYCEKSSTSSRENCPTGCADGYSETAQYPLTRDDNWSLVNSLLVLTAKVLPSYYQILRSTSMQRSLTTVCNGCGKKSGKYVYVFYRRTARDRGRDSQISSVGYGPMKSTCASTLFAITMDADDSFLGLCNRGLPRRCGCPQGIYCFDATSLQFAWRRTPCRL
jgi:hypothetical protein